MSRPPAGTTTSAPFSSDARAAASNDSMAFPRPSGSEKQASSSWGVSPMHSMLASRSRSPYLATFSSKRPPKYGLTPTRANELPIMQDGQHRGLPQSEHRDVDHRPGLTQRGVEDVADGDCVVTVQLRLDHRVEDRDPVEGLEEPEAVDPPDAGPSQHDLGVGRLHLVDVGAEEREVVRRVLLARHAQIEDPGHVTPPARRWQRHPGRHPCTWFPCRNGTLVGPSRATGWPGSALPWRRWGDRARCPTR